MPPGFAFPAGTDLWLPLEIAEPSPSRTAHNHRVVGRLAPGATLARAGEELQRITEGIAAEHPGDDYIPAGARVQALADAISGPVERPLWILLGAAALVLLLACTNLASGFLARATDRAREMAVRRSLGAGVGRLLRQLTAEALVVSLLGAAAGWVLAAVVLEALPALIPEALPRLPEVRLDGAVLAFALAAAGLAALLFGLLPGLGVARGTGAALRGGRTVSAGLRQRRVWSLLTAAEVGLALVLLVGSGLLLKSFLRVLAADLGFSPGGVLALDLDLPASRYAERAAIAPYYAELFAELAGVPGVEAVGLVTDLPLSGRNANGRLEVEGGPEPTADAGYRVVGGAYFEALGIPLLSGRLFEPGDQPASGHVAVVNRAFAERTWPGQDPLGKRLTGGGMDEFWQERTWATVVGVVGDIRHGSLTDAVQPEAYFPDSQRPRRARSASVVVRAKGPAAAVARAVEATVARVDPEVPATLRAMEAVLSQSVADRRFSLTLLGGFAAVALGLACIGIHGVVAYAVARRRRELGVRLALGGDPAAVRGLVVRQSMAAVGLGLAAGLAGALASTRLLASLLHEVEPDDPATFFAVALLLASAAFLATYLPARRVTRIHPTEVLSAE
jgi:predicted permease